MERPTIPELMAAITADPELNRTLAEGLCENIEIRQRLVDRIRGGPSPRLTARLGKGKLL